MQERQGTADALIGAYSVSEALGSGAMGVVYRARHRVSGRAVALKTAKGQSPRSLEAIRREVHALTRIRHPGVVRIVDHGVQAGEPWYAMDLLEGETLRQFKERIWSAHYRPSIPPPISHSRTIPLPISNATEAEPRAHSEISAAHGNPLPAAGANELPQIARIVRSLFGTIAFLHSEGFINCDLKPENIVLVAGKPVIIDFGLATRHPGESSREALLTQRGIVGTLPYMSPEQIRGELLDARSDLYSVGCLLYELVCGHPPFVDTAKSIAEQHLSDPVTPLGQLVSGVPPELEQTIMKLLSKEPGERFSYADEAAAALSLLSGDGSDDTEERSTPSYLCRPRFIDRGGLYSRLAELRDRAAHGQGALVLLGGESGVGKTRLAMELTRSVRPSEMQVITSESSNLSMEMQSHASPAPLDGLRPLFQAIADRCLQGPDVTEQLLGHRHALLSVYVPVFRDLPAHGGSTAVVPLGAEASRQRLFKYLAETLTALAQRSPILWVLDDAGWSDELSLAFLESLSQEFLNRTPIFVLCCYRSEEITPSLSSLLRREQVLRVTVPRLDRAALGAMIADILAIKSPPEDFVAFLADHAEGNPFFLAEYLRAAVNERILVRNQRDSWRLATVARGHDYSGLLLPRSLRELIEHRLSRLSENAQQVALAGAVIGREFDLGSLAEVLGPAQQVGGDAVEELVERQVFERHRDGDMRFAHDKLREVAYARAPGHLVTDLHLRAARMLEARHGNQPDASRIWATLGHHFAMALQPREAASYLRLAGDHARATHANSDAIRLYREALQHLPTTDSSSANPRLELSQALGDVLALTGQRQGARDAYEEAIRHADVAKGLVRARLYRKLGKTWEAQHPHDEALRFYQLARETLGKVTPSEASVAWMDEWIQIRCDQVFANYWPGRVTEMEVIVAELRAQVEDHGSDWQRSRLHRAELQLHFRRDRYVLSQAGVELARACLNDCLARGDLADLPLSHFIFAFSLFLHQDFEAAAWELGSALGIAERTGDVASQARCLTYLSINARRRGNWDEISRYSQRAHKISSATGMHEYIGAALANESALAMRSGKPVEAESLALRALMEWQSLPFVYSFQWTALFPLLRVRLRAGDTHSAARHARDLVHPLQQRLPLELSEHLSTSARAAESGDMELAKERLESALNSSAKFCF